MLRGRGVQWACFVWLTSLLLLGCQRSPSPATNSDLKTINFAYFKFVMQMQKPPSKLDDLTPFLVSTVFPESNRKMEEECLRKLEDGKYTVIWNQPGVVEAKDGTDILIAYEQGAAEKGGYAIFADGRVQWLRSDELQRASQREKP